LTEADLQSHRVIVQSLAQLDASIPLLSEESSAFDVKDRMSWERYWLIDPLDGTKEFIKRNGEFTVNIAYVVNHHPVFGVVYAPVLGDTYWGGVGIGAFKKSLHEQHEIKVRHRPKNESDLKIVGSRSHQSAEFITFMSDYPNAQLVSMGSSLKFCLVAEGVADIYPRLGPTSEWDTAAAQAVVEGAGGKVLSYPDLQPLKYNKNATSLLNPHFLVSA
jgi:3'(2'), 5'-bisphosphate nucleotidase